MSDPARAAAADATSVEAWAASVGLDLPPVPTPFRDRLHRIDDNVFSTRDDGRRPAGMGPLLHELESGPVADYLLLGADGHGIVSWALHWHCVHGPAAVLVQARWAGVDSDDAASAARAADLVRRADDLRRRIVAAPSLPAARLDVVAADHFRSGVWSRDPDQAHGGGSGAEDTLEFAELLLDDLLA